MTDSHARFEAAIEDGTRLLNDWRPLERRIRDTIPDLAAASYDSEPSDPIVWCDLHERPVKDCHRNDELCTGTPLAKRTDPTGDAAVNNTARDDTREWVFHARKVSHHIEQMARIAGKYKPDDPQLSLDVEEANTKPDGCEFCDRVGKWRIPMTKNPTDVGGILDVAKRCCQGHYDFIRTRGRGPTEEENDYYGRKDKWPKAVGQMDHMRVGAKTGAW